MKLPPPASGLPRELAALGYRLDGFGRLVDAEDRVTPWWVAEARAAGLRREGARP